jgi:hypothetical protein
MDEAGRFHSANTENSQIFFSSPRFNYKQSKNRSANSIGTA